MASRWTDASIKGLLRQIFDAAVADADAKAAVLRNLPDIPAGRVVVVGAGKASAAMAAAIDEVWVDVDLSGVVVTRYGHGVPTNRIEVIEASHPIPDGMSVEAGERILKAVQGLTENDLVIAMISGGGSALLAVPEDGISLADKQALNRELLASGASIAEMNAIRKCFSKIKGGKLAAAARPAKVMTMIISDIPGDDASQVASGPTLPSRATLPEVRGIIRRYGIKLPPAMKAHLASASLAATELDYPVNARLVATPRTALEQAAAVGRSHGLNVVILGDAMEGEARELGKFLAAMAHSSRRHGDPTPLPALFLSGGEATVTMRKNKGGRGGRNTELLLSLAIALRNEPGVWAIAGDTDGIDGTEDAAGAIITPTTFERAQHLGLNAHESLDHHDSYTFFSALGDLFFTGPTLTNINDIRAVLVLP
ncbi:glycerate kinase [Phyllobacterium sp. SB3]|uniref:glycerate kinase type-2 family protein n=1 Tax=Phyllobacterium sp. SB3 TaxID=3156073 RepID=UPI0032AEC63C